MVTTCLTPSTLIVYGLQLTQISRVAPFVSLQHVSDRILLALGTVTYPSRAWLVSLGTAALVVARGADTLAAEDIVFG